MKYEGIAVIAAPQASPPDHAQSHRRVAVLDLVEDQALIAAYEARHAPGAVWPEVIDDIHAQGILDMEIWRVSDRLVMILQVADDYPRSVPSSPRAEEWQEVMWHFQRAIPAARAGEKWVEMTRIFALDEQSGVSQ